MSPVPLNEGERYAGDILNEDGSVAHHLILLPGDVDDVTWEQATAWAAQQGGELPTRREQRLLIANLKGVFEARYYWSAEQCGISRAWFQSFGGGDQYARGKDYQYRARAIRRVAAQPAPSATDAKPCADCGIPLTPTEIHYYGATCETCEGKTMLAPDAGTVAAAPASRHRELTTDKEELRAEFQRQAKDSRGFRRSRKGNYINPQVQRDWKWFQAGARAALSKEPKP